MKQRWRVNRTPGPRLQALLDAGTVWPEDGSYVGRASDGTIVSLGHEADCDGTERYLAACPGPEQW